MKTKRNRVLALVLCLTLVLDCTGIAYADNSGKQTTEAAEAPVETELPPDTISDDEAVYVLTDAAGTVEKVIVSDRIQEANGEESVTKTQKQKELPVDVRFTYRLDGREIAPEELAGKSGRVEIRIDYTNNAWAVKEISGKVDLTIPDHVTVTADAKDFALGSVYTLVANNLFKDYDEKDPDALQKLISSMNELTDAMDQLLDGAQALNDGLDTLLAKSEDLTNGVSALCDGADQVASGAGTLKTGAEKLASGTRDVKNGADQLAAGAGSLLSGADHLAGGAAQLSAGLDQLSANSAAINDGAETVFKSLLSAAETQLKANGLSVAALTISNYQTELDRVIASLDPDAVYARALAQVTEAVEARRPEIEALVTAAVREQVTEAVTAAVRQNVSEQVRAAVAAQVRAQVIRAATGLTVEEYEAAVESGAIDEATQAAIEAQIAAQMASSEVQAQIEAAVDAQMASEEVQGLIAQNVEARMASEEIRTAIADNTEAQVRKAIADAMAGPEVQAKLAAAAEGAKSVIALKTSLDQYDAFYLGVKSYTAGVDAAAQGAQELHTGAAALKTGASKLADGSAALSDGTRTLSDGADALTDGAAALSDGADSLAAGTHKLQDSLPALIDGIRQLRDGAGALDDGLNQFNKEGVQKLTKLVTVDAEGLAERLRAMADLGKAYRASYTGLPDETDGELRFIYRSAAIGE